MHTLAWSKLRGETGYDKRRLIGLAEHAQEYYRPFDVRRLDSTKWRHIDNPIGALKTAQARIKRFLERGYRTHPVLHGGVRRRSTRTAAAVHVGAREVVGLDISSYFPSITSRAVHAFFRRAGFIPDVARALTRITTYRGHLPHGAPTSTVLANLVNRPMFDAIDAHVRARGCVMTVYVDDINLSGDSPTDCVPGVVALAHKFGHRIAREKIRAMAAPGEQVMLGLRVDRGIELPRGKKTDLLARITTVEAEGRITTGELDYFRKLLAYVSAVDTMFVQRLGALVSGLNQRVRVVVGENPNARLIETTSCDPTLCMASPVLVR